MDTLLVLQRPLATPPKLKIKISGKKKKRRTRARGEGKVAKELVAGEGDAPDTPTDRLPEPVCFSDLCRGVARCDWCGAAGDHASAAAVSAEIVLEIPYGDSADKILNVPEIEI